MERLSQLITLGSPVFKGLIIALRSACIVSEVEAERPVRLSELLDALSERSGGTPALEAQRRLKIEGKAFSAMKQKVEDKGLARSERGLLRHMQPSTWRHTLTDIEGKEAERRLPSKSGPATASSVSGS